MTRPVSTIRNLGPRSEAMFASAGIHDAETLEALGAVEAHRRLRAAGVRTSLLGLYALWAGLQDRDWRSVTSSEKAMLRAALGSGDTLPSDGPSAMEAALDALGLAPAPQPTSSSPEKK